MDEPFDMCMNLVVVFIEFMKFVPFNLLAILSTLNSTMSLLQYEPKNRFHYIWMNQSKIGVKFWFVYNIDL
jgi:hypothetical protein